MEKNEIKIFCALVVAAMLRLHYLRVYIFSSRAKYNTQWRFATIRTCYYLILQCKYMYKFLNKHHYFAYVYNIRFVKQKKNRNYSCIRKFKVNHFFFFLYADARLALIPDRNLKT